MSAAALAIIIYLPTSIQVWQGKMKLNLATFLLWGVLDAIAALSIYVKGGNWALPAAYVAGVLLVIVAMLRARTFTWTRFETITTFMVAISIGVWMISGPVMATVVSTTAMVLAGIPQVKDAWQKPWEATVWVWFAYFVVNVMSTVAGKDWSISERFYPAACSVLTAIMVVLAMRKFWVPAPAHT
ncbi:MAG: hypothetical protein AB202_00635 [Parcubacteria bacterium C7867-007]|nr:MAG: hypothetical protein AB202_00635 [Parcubacteria bacterium C7867-007]